MYISISEYVISSCRMSILYFLDTSSLSVRKKLRVILLLVHLSPRRFLAVSKLISLVPLSLA